MKFNIEVLHNILRSFPEDLINLPGMPNFDSTEINNSADNTMSLLEKDLGDAAILSDYYKCSKIRFYEILKLCYRYSNPNSRILDIGNAPGYLAQALVLSGHTIQGLNLSKEWDCTYPRREMIEEFSIISCDIEKEDLPFPDNTFDSIIFAEVLEHIAIKNPCEIIPEFLRVLKPSGYLFFSTPNVCNISNIIALSMGLNVFWDSSIFYGSTDRHNREFTPNEVLDLFTSAGFIAKEHYGINDHANWRKGAAESTYKFLSENPINHPLIRNTVIGVYQKPL